MTEWHPVYTVLIAAAVNLIPAFFLIHYQRKLKKGDEDRDKLFAEIELNKNKTRASVISLKRQMKESQDSLELSVKGDAAKIELRVQALQEDMALIREALIKIEHSNANTGKFIDENRQFFGKVQVLENNLGRVETDVRRIYEFIGRNPK